MALNSVVWGALALCLSLPSLAAEKGTRVPGQNDRCAAYCYSNYSPHLSNQVSFVENPTSHTIIYVLMKYYKLFISKCAETFKKTFLTPTYNRDIAS